jgi:hypothetical protein
MIRNSNPEDSFYNSVSASWELGFNKHFIAVGSKSLKEADIITDPNQVKELTKFLKAKGGNGKLNDGTPIYRVIVGDIYPLGGGFTTNPAAQVNGVVAFDEASSITLENDEKEEESEEKSNANDDSDCAQEIQIFVTNKKSNSILDRKNVKNINHMDLEKLIAELKSALLEKKFGEEAVASMTAHFADAIKKKDAEYRDSIATEKQAKEQAQKLYDQTVASVEAMKVELANTQSELNKIKEAQEQEQAVARLNARIGDLDAIYELSDEDRKVIIAEVQTVEVSQYNESHQTAGSQ